MEKGMTKKEEDITFSKFSSRINNKGVSSARSATTVQYKDIIKH